MFLRKSFLFRSQVRKWLARCRQRKQETMLDLVPGGLTDARRFELQTVIANIREKHAVMSVFNGSWYMAYKGFLLFSVRTPST